MDPRLLDYYNRELAYIRELLQLAVMDDLLAALLEIEHDFGRRREYRNAPRTLDLDVLLYGEVQQDDPTLTLPHPRAHERSFVMLPLAEIAPDYALGSYGTAAGLAERLGGSGIDLFSPPI